MQHRFHCSPSGRNETLAVSSSNPNEGNNSPTSTSEVNSSSSTTETTDGQTSKTDAEVALEAMEIALNGISDVAEILRIKDSVRQANKTKMFAYQIGIKMREDDAYNATWEYRTTKTNEVISAITNNSPD